MNFSFLQMQIDNTVDESALSVDQRITLKKSMTELFEGVPVYTVDLAVFIPYLIL